MKRVIIYCEGYTEETFVNELLQPFFLEQNIYVFPIICQTSKTINRKYKGGVTEYSKIKRELNRICLSHRNEFVTSLFDFYAMPTDTPGIDIINGDLFDKVNQIERLINEDINCENLFFNFAVHEFEGLLFSNPTSFNYLTIDETIISSLNRIRNSYKTPEFINSGSTTAPSKRIKSLIPSYKKVTDGNIIALDIGIQKIISECEHFSKWIEKIIFC